MSIRSHAGITEPPAAAKQEEKPMKIALINENSQAAKNELVESVLKKVVEPMGHEVVNYGITKPKLRFCWKVPTTCVIPRARMRITSASCLPPG